MTGQLLTEGDVYAIWLRDEGRAVRARLFVERDMEGDTYLQLQPVNGLLPFIVKRVQDIEVKGRVLKTIRRW